MIEVPAVPGPGRTSPAPLADARKTTGKAGSVEVEIPPPKGRTGRQRTPSVTSRTGRHRDAWTNSDGNTRTTVNLAKATFNALENASQSDTPRQRGGRDD